MGQKLLRNTAWK